MAIEYDPSENPTTGIPFSNGQEEAGLINKKSEGGAYTNESVGEYATAVSAANNAKQSELNAAESETNAATSATNAASSATASANSATASADSASSSATSADNAATSETNAATSATNAANSATNASTSETNAATSESNAATSASNAATSETNASTSESNAATSEANAAISETNAANSASASASSATASATSASHAATSESNASTSEDNALASATAAANSASAAAASEANAQASAAAALASEQAAQSSEDDAETAQVAAESAQASAEAAETAAETAQVAAETAQTASESAQTAAESAQASATASANSATASATSAASSAQDAQSSEDDAETSATAAAASASAASSSASAASTSATASATSATQSATSASNAATSASNAATSETNAATSATNAFSSETAAATSEANASNSATASANSATASASSAAAALASETAAATSETNTAASELAAATSESNAATSESNAATSETNAATSETNAATSETNASNSATAALASETAAATSEANASTSETNAAASESAAATSESNASASATSAANSASAASLSASAASTSETNAAASELAASISETNTATSETNASTSATAAATSATSASTSASSAASSESAASASELAAATSEANAASSATSAASSATAAASSATSASDSASAAAASETNAETAETNAASSASAAATSETNAANSATASANSATNAATSETNAEAVKTTLYGIYLGLATEDPTVDLNGQALSGGEFYYNTTTNITRIYNGTSWVNGAVDTSSFVLTNSDATLDSLQLNGGTGTQGTLSWNTDEETVDLILDGATLQLGQEVHYHVRNNTASAIPNGTAVYATGTLGASGRITIAPFLADGNTPAKYFIGITTEEIAAGADGKVTDFGKVRNLDTTSYNDGDVLYPSSTVAGGLTNVAPTSPALSIPCAFVVYSGNNGNIFVRVHPQDENAYATYSQGALADTAVQPGDNVSDLTNDASYATTSYVDTAESDAVSTANAYTDTRETAITTAYESYTDTAISNLVDTAPTTLDTLNELAAALGDDPNFATTVSNSIGTKAAKTTTVSAGTALTGGGDLSTNRTISHASVSRSNTTDTGSLAHSGTFTAITDVTTNTQGHVTGAKTTTYTLPAGYSHPSYAGDDINLDTGPLSGATVISDLDFNVTTDTLGHVTDANATYSTRTLTAADIGAQPAGNYVLRTGDTMTGTLTVPNLTIGSGNKIKFANNDYIRYDDANGVGRWHFDSDGGTNNSSVQAATFVGALSGNASTSSKWATARTNTVTLTGDATGSGSASVDGSGNWTVSVPVTVANDSHTHDSRYAKRYSSTATIADTTNYTQVAKVTGDRLGSAIRLAINGTSNSVVIDIIADIIVNHSGDIIVQALSGNYTQCYIQIVSNGNESFDIRLRGTGSVSNTEVSVDIFTMNNESVTFTGTTSYSGTTLTHLTYPGSSLSASDSGAGDLRVDDIMYVNTNQRVFAENYHPNADKWTTARTLSLTGDVTGSVSWDGSGNASITTVVGDADTVDGLHASQFLRSDTWVDQQGGVNITNDIGTTISWTSSSAQLSLENTDAGWVGINFHRAGYTSNNLYHNGATFTFDDDLTIGGTSRSTIHYDSNNTGYYLDPANNGLSILVNGDYQTNGGKFIIDRYNETGNTFQLSRIRSSTWPFRFVTEGVGNDNDSGFWVGPNGYPDMRLRRENGTVRALISSWERSYTSYGLTDSTDMRAPIFYDSNNTGYYVNPASTSNINSLNVATINRSPTVTLSGDVTGSATMTNLGSINISTTVANDSHTHDGRYTRVHSGSFTVGGDANTYYPVYFAGGSQQLMTEVEIYRAYSETAPSTWNTSTHKGGLNFKFRANWGGWGGASYDLHIEDFRESYSTMVGDMGWFGNSRGFYVLLRGGGALYHFRASGGSAGTPTVYDAGTSVDPYGNGSGISARTSVNTSGYLYSRNFTRNSVVYSRNEETAHLGGDQTKSGVFQSNTSLRAPIFYDSNNTGYYANFASTGTSINIAGILVEASDAKLKTNLEVIPDALDKVKQLNGYTYDRIDSGERQAGVIAQEVEKVLPEVVREGEHKSVSYGNMVALLIEAIKEQQVQIDELKNELNTLKG